MAIATMTPSTIVTATAVSTSLSAGCCHRATPEPPSAQEAGVAARRRRPLAQERAGSPLSLSRPTGASGCFEFAMPVSIGKVPLHTGSGSLRQSMLRNWCIVRQLSGPSPAIVAGQGKALHVCIRLAALPAPRL